MRRILLALALVVGTLPPASADDLTAVSLVDRVEEDWELVVDSTASPDGPQINTVMCPVADLSKPAVVLDINYRHSPSYAAGGLQVLVYGPIGIFKTNTLATSPLSLANEKVKWTQRMNLSGGTVQYVISSVSSATWGTYTDNDVLTSFDASLDTLAAYDPAASAANSGGAWKTQGLTSLTLVRVRYYQGSILLRTDSTPRTVDCSKPFSRP